MPQEQRVIPPGIYRNGTLTDATDRFYDCDRVRWSKGAHRPIGGWDVYRDQNMDAINALTSTPESEIFRDAFSWRSISGQANGVFGSNSGLVHLSAGGTITDITPSSLPAAPADPSPYGFGYGNFGRGTFGTPRTALTQTVIDRQRWRFASWGEELLALFVGNSLYSWDLIAAEATVVSNAPTDFVDFVTTPQRIVLGIGSTNDPNLIRWSGREDYSFWDFADETKLAGFYSIEDSLGLQSVGVVQDDVLVLGNGAHIGQFTGLPFVYSFNTLATDCPPISKYAVCYTGNFAVWMGLDTFWLFDGTVRPLPCSVSTWLFDEIDRANLSKMWVTHNTENTEIWWFFQSANGSDVDSYVLWNYVADLWYFGRLRRTCGFDAGAFTTPLYVNLDGVVYRHELKNTLVSSWYLETGPLSHGYGAKGMALKEVYPDAEDTGAYKLTVLGRQFHSKQYATFGPYAYTYPISTTGAQGRHLRFRYEGQPISYAVIGNRIELNHTIGAGR